MGIQSWKGQRRTGNTIRAHASFGNKKESTGSAIVKRRLVPHAPAARIETGEQEQYQKKSRKQGRRRSKALHEDKKHSDFEEAEELEGLEEGIVYSLNKKGRWNIPEMMISEIQHTKQNVEVDAKDKHKRRKQSDADDKEPDMTIYQLHYGERRSRCIAFYSTKLPGDGSVQKSKTYLNSDSILKKNLRRKLKKQRKTDGSDQQEETVNRLGTTEVAVLYPNSRLCFGAKRSERYIHKSTRLRPDTSIDTFDCFSCDEVSDVEDGNYDETYIKTNNEMKLNERNAGGKVAGMNTVDSDEEYEWFLAVNVQTPNGEVCSDSSSDEELDTEKNNEKLDEIVNNDSLEDDWVFAEYEETKENTDVDILAQLISEAFARKASTANGTQTTSSKRRRSRTQQGLTIQN